MLPGARPRFPVRLSRLGWLVLATGPSLGVAGDACAQIAAQTGAQAEAPVIAAPPPVVRTVPGSVDPVPDLDPQSPLAPMPDIGIAWPDMDAPDSVTPILAETPVDQAAEKLAGDAPAMAPVGEGDAPATTATARGAGADGGEGDEPVSASVDGAAERRYDVVLHGLDLIADAQFDQRFDQLSALKQGENKAANLAQINRRIKEDSTLLDRLMRAKGYYDARIRGSVSAPPAGRDRLQAVFDIVPGPLYLLGSVDVEGLAAAGDREPAMREAFTVSVGDPIDADTIVAAQASLVAALGENGFPFARVEDPQIRVDHETRKGDLDIIVVTGGYRSFGQILLPDESLFNSAHVQEIARFKPGETYNASDVDDLRRALVATGLVSSVTMTPREAGDGSHVDLDVALSPAPPRTIAGEIGYGTGEGFRVEGSWQHRNLFPPEGALTVRGVVGTQEQTGSVTFRRNNFRARDHVLTGLLSVSNLKRNAYDARTIQISGTLERQTNIIFQKKWVWSVGTELVASRERGTFSTIVAGRRTFLIAALPTGLTYDGSDDLLDPTRGFRLGGRLSPEISLQNGAFGYARAQVDGSYYRPVTDRVVLAARARFGSILGSSASRIAPTRRFYAGGGGSVRGYSYQAIGPRDSNNDPVGGKSLAEFSIEARVRFGNFGIVPFVDAGNISTSFLPHFNDLRIGAGVGARYYSNFGPIRFDVGTPINRQPGDSRIAVYVSLGQAF